LFSVVFHGDWPRWTLALLVALCLGIGALWGVMMRGI